MRGHCLEKNYGLRTNMTNGVYHIPCNQYLNSGYTKADNVCNSSHLPYKDQLFIHLAHKNFTSTNILILVFLVCFFPNSRSWFYHLTLPQRYLFTFIHLDWGEMVMKLVLTSIALRYDEYDLWWSRIYIDKCCPCS